MWSRPTSTFIALASSVTVACAQAPAPVQPAPAVEPVRVVAQERAQPMIPAPPPEPVTEGSGIADPTIQRFSREIKLTQKTSVSVLRGEQSLGTNHELTTLASVQVEASSETKGSPPRLRFAFRSIRYEVGGTSVALDPGPPYAGDVWICTSTPNLVCLDAATGQEVVPPDWLATDLDPMFPPSFDNPGAWVASSTPPGAFGVPHSSLVRASLAFPPEAEGSSRRRTASVEFTADSPLPVFGTDFTLRSTGSGTVEFDARSRQINALALVSESFASGLGAAGSDTFRYDRAVRSELTMTQRRRD